MIAYLDAIPSAQEMLADIGDLVEKWLPAYARDSRHYLTVAIGCTGGQHRSVYFAEQLAARFMTDRGRAGAAPGDEISE